VSDPRELGGYPAWRAYVASIADAYRGFAGVGAAAPAAAAEGAVASGARTLVVFAPHPDDEAITGAFALRARDETGARVVVAAATLGSNPARKSARLAELRASCSSLGFEPALLGGEHGLALDGVTTSVRERDPSTWQRHVALAREVLDREAPDVVVLPHAHDAHRTHEGVHLLALEAARAHARAAARRLLLVETEYWRPMARPNLLLGLSEEHEARLLTAITCHTGEIARNAYHLRHPGRMLDNVRRGAEVVLGEGAGAPDLLFGELYRVSRLAGDQLTPPPGFPRLVGPDDTLDFDGWLRS